MKQQRKLDNSTTGSAAILIAGEQSPLLTSVQALLRINGYAAEVACSLEQALAQLEQQRLELVILDMSGSVHNRDQLVEFLGRSAPDQEVIVLGSDSTFAFIKSSFYLGACTLVRKPYRPDDLLVAVSHGLERRHYRQQLLQAEQALTESERVHRFIVNNSPDFIYMLDAEGNFTFVNDMVESLLGYKRHEILGRHYTTIIHPHNAEIAQRFFNEQRTGDRAAKAVDIQLLRNPDQRHDEEKNDGLMVELNTIGLYALEDGVRTYTGTLGSVRDITERKRSEARITYQACHDQLTRLPNRTLFADRVEQALAHASRNQQQFAVMFIDLDHFKQINDSYGHVVGDRLLKAASQRMLASVRTEDTLCRFGGDEFALLLREVDHEKDAVAVAEKILAAMESNPLEIDQLQLSLSLSIGIAIYPAAGDSLERLLRGADVAMYQVKVGGRGSYSVYGPWMENVFSPAPGQGLKQALTRRQLQVFFQPKVNSGSHTIVGMEALLRWQHPERGLLYPAEFIAEAERSGDIVPIDEWVLGSVCQEMVRWQQQQLPSLKVSLNLSTQQLTQEDYADRFIDTLKQYQLDCNRFEVQVTEQMILDGQQQIVSNLRALSQLGVIVVIDNFGCGNSSLGYLRNFPVHTLMIDPSFVRDIVQDNAPLRIADGIAMMAKALNLNLTAKGVENLVQLEHLRALGCTEVQGYLYGEAVSASATLNMLKARSAGGLHINLPTK